MIRLSGKAVYKGIALGPAAVLEKSDRTAVRVKIVDTDEELSRLKKAVEKTIAQLQKLYDKAFVRRNICRYG